MEEGARLHATNSGVVTFFHCCLLGKARVLTKRIATIDRARFSSDQLKT
jgi:hypothetical protein